MVSLDALTDFGVPSSGYSPANGNKISRLPTILLWRQRHAQDLRPGTRTRGAILFGNSGFAPPHTKDFALR